MSLGGLYFKCRADQHGAESSAAAMISFVRVEKKVTGGAWFDISLHHLSADKRHEDVFFGSFCRLRHENGPKVDSNPGDSGVLSK